MRSPKVILAVTALAFLLSIKPNEATRILDEEERLWMKKEQNLLLPSLQHRPVKTPSPNSCSWIPGGGGSPCTASIGQRNFAGHVIASPPPATLSSDAYPQQMQQFGLASDDE